MEKIRYVLLGTFIFSSIILTGCSIDEMKQSAQDTVNQRVNQATQEVTNQVSQQVDKATQELTNQAEESAKKTINQKVNSMMKSVENKIDPKLGEIRKNMDDIKDAALVYFKINNKMPNEDKISSLFSKTFSQMQLQYKPSEDNLKATISYIGKDYTKEKLPDILVDPNNQ